MRGLLSIMACIAAAAVVGSLLGCASGGGDPVIVRVGERAITRAQLAHWMSAFAPEHVVPDPPRFTACALRREQLGSQASPSGSLYECKQQYRALERRALDFLIYSAWSIGEARDRGIGASHEDVERRLDRLRRSYPGGEREFVRSLKAIAHTVADSELEAEAQISLKNLRMALLRREPVVGPGEIAEYYRRHPAQFHEPEWREFRIIENLKSEAAANRLTREIEDGRESLARLSLHESFPRKDFARIAGVQKKLFRAIFAARPGALSEPVKLNNLYFLFEVTRIVPPRQQSLSQASGSIREKIRAARGARSLAEFASAWQRRWIARTHCSPGYIVDLCREYRGGRRPAASLGSIERLWSTD
jgi:PPIC-type PPIASE domain